MHRATDAWDVEAEKTDAALESIASASLVRIERFQGGCGHVDQEAEAEAEAEVAKK